MKIVIQSNCGPYALSRHDLEAVAGVLPARIVRQIDQLHVGSNRWGIEPFEYDPKRGVAYFSYPGDPTDAEVRQRALCELLLGFARLEANAEFRVHLSDRQREKFRPFIEQWYPQCVPEVLPNKPLQPTRAASLLGKREAARCGPRG